MLAVLIPVISIVSFFAYLWVDYNNSMNDFRNAVNSTPGVLQGFQQLSKVTPASAIVYSWWDYGQLIQDIGGRTPVVKYPSMDILDTVSHYGTFPGSVEEQLFGTFEPSDKIHDVARGFLVPENQSLSVMQKYGAAYVMVFEGLDWDVGKFSSIAKIAGYNPSDYITYKFNSTTRQTYPSLTSLAGQVTMLRLLFDKTFPPQHFTKVYDNNVTKIYSINYPQYANPTEEHSAYSGPTFITPFLMIPSMASPSSIGRVRTRNARIAVRN